MGEEQLVVYGTTWCGHCHWVRQILDRQGVDYRWIDIDRDSQGRRRVERINHGFRSVPTMVFPDGTVLVEPSERQLWDKLAVQEIGELE